jgi:predicted transcriptional regulator
MRRASDDVTDTELAMLQVLWDRGTATRRQVTDALYPNGDAAHYATVQKLLGRLEAKGYVRHTREQGVLQFTATVGREELISRRLRDVADKLCGGSLTPLMINLVRSQPLSARELEELQAFLEELRHPNKPRGKQR